MQAGIEDMMAQSPVRFGTSGVRGLVSHMTDEVCFAYTAAFLKTIDSEPQTPVLLGHDLRPSSPRIARACAAAIADAGCRLIYAGALPTPALAWYARLIRAPALVVTGSHIPFDRNGIKFYRAEAEITKADERAIQAQRVQLPDVITPVTLPLTDTDALSAYVQRYVDFFGPDSLAGMRVAVYEHSSVARDLLRTVLEALGATVIPLGRTDTFVPIDTEAVRHQDVVQARSWAAEINFDAIVSTDGDADRPLIGDEQGNWLRGDMAGVFCARFLAARYLVTPLTSSTVAEQSGWFQQVVRTRIGSPYVIEAMEQLIRQGRGSVLGYEANGGVLLGSDIVRHGRTLAALPTRDALLPILSLLMSTRIHACKMSALTLQLPSRFTASALLPDVSVARSADLIAQFTASPGLAAKIMAPYAGEVISSTTLDGLRLYFANGDIVHLRPSGNAPELRCYAEAASQQAAQTLSDDCLERLQSNGLL